MAKRPEAQRLTSGFARRLRAARVVGGYTQEEFSRLLGIKRDRYAKYELGQAEPPFFILAKVSNLTRQSLDTLIGGRAVLGHESMNIVGYPLADIQAVTDKEEAWWWKTDAQHRVVEVWHLHNHIPEKGYRDHLMNKTRWAAAEGDPKADDIWKAHVEDLDARRAFEDLRYVVVASNGASTEVSVSGKPVFDDGGNFEGYVGFAFKSNGDALSTEVQ